MILLLLFAQTLLGASQECEKQHDAAMNYLDQYSGNWEYIEKAENAIKNGGECGLKYLVQARISYTTGLIRDREFTPESLEEAHRLIDKAEKLEPTDPRVKYRRALVVGREKMAEEAIDILDSIPEGAFHTSKIEHAKGQIYSQNEMWDEAIVHCEKSLKTAVEESTRRYCIGDLAISHEKVGNYRKAEQYFRMSIGLEPKSPWRRNNYCSFLKRRKHYNEAIIVCEQGLQLMDFGMVRKNLGDSYYLRARETIKSRGNLDDAISDLQKSIALVPHVSYTHFHLGLAYLYLFKERRGCYEQWAIIEFKRGYDLNPNTRESATYYENYERYKKRGKKAQDKLVECEKTIPPYSH